MPTTHHIFSFVHKPSCLYQNSSNYSVYISTVKRVLIVFHLQNASSFTISNILLQLHLHRWHSQGPLSKPYPNPGTPTHRASFIRNYPRLLSILNVSILLQLHLDKTSFQGHYPHLATPAHRISFISTHPILDYYIFLVYFSTTSQSSLSETPTPLSPFISTLQPQLTMFHSSARNHEACRIYSIIM